MDYFFFHFVTDTGITLIRQEEAGKPFVALLIGIFATLLLFGGVVSLIGAFTLTDKNKDD